MLNEGQFNRTEQKKTSRGLVLLVTLSWIIYFLSAVAVTIILLGFASDSGKGMPVDVKFLLTTTHLISLLVMIFITRKAILKESMLLAFFSLPIVAIVAQFSFFTVGVFILPKTELVLPPTETLFVCSNVLAVEVSDGWVGLSQITKNSKTTSSLGSVKNAEIFLKLSTPIDDAVKQMALKECRNIRGKTVSDLYIIN